VPTIAAPSCPRAGTAPHVARVEARGRTSTPGRRDDVLAPLEVLLAPGLRSSPAPQ